MHQTAVASSKLIKVAMKTDSGMEENLRRRIHNRRSILFPESEAGERFLRRVSLTPRCLHQLHCQRLTKDTNRRRLARERSSDDHQAVSNSDRLVELDATPQEALGALKTALEARRLNACRQLLIIGLLQLDLGSRRVQPDGR
jgi:hypothetical protein